MLTPTATLRILLAASFSSAAFGQSISIDVGALAGSPATGHPGAAHLAGTWNTIAAPFTPTPLVDVDGAATSVTWDVIGGGGEVQAMHPGLEGSRGGLLRDGRAIEGQTTWRFLGLAPGNYRVTTYAWSPLSPQTPHEVEIGAAEVPIQESGGSVPNEYTLGIDHVRHCVAVDGSPLAIVVRELGTDGVVCGFQFEREGSPPAPASCELELLIPSNERSGDAMALDGGTLAVQSPIDRGVDVYAFDGTSWNLTQVLFPSQGSDHFFGEVMVIDGDIMFIGSPDPSTSHIAYGTVFVFERGPGGFWSEIQMLSASDAQDRAQFGAALALQGSRLVVGSPEYDHSGLGRAGSAYIFEHGPGGWVETAVLRATDPGWGDRHGRAVAIEGDFAFIGAPFRSIGGISGAGRVVIFERTASGWAQVDTWEPSVVDPNRRFGSALATASGWVIVGAFHNAVAGRGTVEFWNQDAAGWTRDSTVFSSTSEPDDHFGWSLSASGKRLLIGAPGQDGPGTNTGRAFVFELSGSAWIETEVITSPGTSATNFQFGDAVAIDGTRLAALALDNSHGKAWARSCEETLGQRYCSPNATNSSGCPSTLEASGSPHAGDGEVRLVARALPAAEFGLFLASRDEGFVPKPGGSFGNLCLGGSIARFLDSVGATSATGTLEFVVDTSAVPTNPTAPILPGDTWHFQGWHRDGNRSNFTDAVRVTFD